MPGSLNLLTNEANYSVIDDKIMLLKNILLFCEGASQTDLEPAGFTQPLRLTKAGLSD